MRFITFIVLIFALGPGCGYYQYNGDPPSMGRWATPKENLVEYGSMLEQLLSVPFRKH